MVAELTEIDALPGAKVETASTDGDGDGNSCQGALGMRGHVVQPLERVVVVRDGPAADGLAVERSAAARKSRFYFGKRWRATLAPAIE